MNLSNNDAATIFDIMTNGETDCSLESILTQLNVSIDSHDALMRFKLGLSKLNMISDQYIDEPYYEGQEKHVPSFVGKDSEKEQTIIVDDELFLAAIIGNHQVINKFIQQIVNIKESAIVNIIIDISYDQVDYPGIDAGSFIMNMIRSCKAKKIFNFGSCIGFLELMMATCCDEIYVSDFAGVSLVRRIDSNRIPRFIYPVFKQFARFTFKYWVDKGLFTVEEIQDFGESESKGSINLLSDEIKARLNK